MLYPEKGPLFLPNKRLLVKASGSLRLAPPRCSNPIWPIVVQCKNAAQ
jgi:hypothetical protein